MRRRWELTAVAAALACALSAGPHAQPSASAADTAPAGHLVHLDVFATDGRGRTIDDLKPGDFELREEGAPQQLQSVTFVREPARDASTRVAIQSVEDERAAAAGGARLFAIFLDEYHVTSGISTDRAREAVAQFVETALTPRDLVVVMKPLDSIFAIRLTADRDAALQTIRNFDGRKGDFEPRNSYERNFIAGTPVRIEAARNQVAWSAINALAVHMGRLADLRKTLIVVSESIGAAEHRRGQEFLATRDTAIRSANRANVAIYALDPSESAAATPDADPLRLLSSETDGAFIAGDLEAGLRRAAADSHRYYLLTYRSARQDDGRFHELQVQAKRPGVQLRARKGYVAPAPDEALRAELLAHANDPKPVVPPEPAPHASPLIRPWFGVSRGADGKSRVTFVWEPASRVPGDRSAVKNPSRLVFTAKTVDGTVLFDGPVAATGPAALDAPGETSARAVFEMRPGRLRLRMSIEDVTSRVLDTDVRDIAIRELKGDVAVGTPEVLRARNAREFRTLETDDAVPVSSREFSRTERLLIRFPAYAANGAAPAVSAKLLGRTGQVIRDLTVNAGADGGEHTIDLSLAGMASGEYIVEVRAQTATGDAKDRVSFRVTP
jgi:VWFA-related protein